MEFTVTWREIIVRTPNTCETIKPVDGLARTIKPKASLARARTTASKTKERANKTAKKGRKAFTKWRGTKTNKKHETFNNTQGGRTRFGITLTTGLTQTCGRDWSKQRADHGALGWRRTRPQVQRRCTSSSESARGIAVDEQLTLRDTWAAIWRANAVEPALAWPEDNRPLFHLRIRVCGTAKDAERAARSGN